MIHYKPPSKHSSQRNYDNRSISQVSPLSRLRSKYMDKSTFKEIEEKEEHLLGGFDDILEPVAQKYSYYVNIGSVR